MLKESFFKNSSISYPQQREMDVPHDAQSHYIDCKKNPLPLFFLAPKWGAVE